METITFLERNIISNFVNLLKNVENKKIILIENQKYIPFFEIDNKNNKFEINIEYMIKNEGQNKFEINNEYYKQISSYILRKIMTIDASKKFYRELLTLCSYLFQYNIRVKNLKKFNNPDFIMEEENGEMYLIETFFSKDKADWYKNKEYLEWSLLNSCEDINKTNLNENLNINHQLHFIENSINNLKLEKARTKMNVRPWIFNYNEAFVAIDKHLKKLQKYRKNEKSIKNLIFLIELGTDKYIDKKDMEYFSQYIISKTKIEKYNFYNFKIKIILINQLDNYDFFLN